MPEPAAGPLNSRLRRSPVALTGLPLSGRQKPSLPLCRAAVGDTPRHRAAGRHARRDLLAHAGHHCRGVVEQALDLNPGLSETALIAAGTPVLLPDPPTGDPVSTLDTTNLWD
jgi:phage tail protein X